MPSIGTAHTLQYPRAPDRDVLAATEHRRTAASPSTRRPIASGCPAVSVVTCDQRLIVPDSDTSARVRL
jgi:hypothetical protein